MNKFFLLCTFNTVVPEKVALNLVQRILLFLTYFGLTLTTNYLILRYKSLAFDVNIFFLISSFSTLIFDEDFSLVKYHNQIHKNKVFIFSVTALHFFTSHFFTFISALFIGLICSLSFYGGERSALIILSAIFLYNCAKFFFLNIVKRSGILKYIFFTVMLMIDICQILLGITTERGLLLLMIFFLIQVLIFFIYRKNIFYGEKKTAESNHVFFSRSREALNIYYYNICFLTRVKRLWFVFAIIVYFGTIIFLSALTKINPEAVFAEPNFYSLLFFALSTASMEAVIGPYLLPWILFYYEDLKSKGNSLKNILVCELNFYRITVLVSLIFILPFIIIFNLPIGRFIYFSFTNISLTPLSIFIINIFKLHKTDSEIKPSENSEKGDLLSAWLPWLSVIVSIGLYMLMKRAFDDFVMAFFGFLLFALIVSLDTPIVEKFETVFLRTLNLKNGVRKND